LQPGITNLLVGCHQSLSQLAETLVFSNLSSRPIQFRAGRNGPTHRLALDGVGHHPKGAVSSITQAGTVAVGLAAFSVTLHQRPGPHLAQLGDVNFKFAISNLKFLQAWG
jgi:hypothetical protein